MADQTRQRAVTDLRCPEARIRLSREAPAGDPDDRSETRPPPGTPFVRYVFTARGCGRSERYRCRFIGCEPSEPKRECGRGTVTCRHE
jgi:hypothetical protein